jgi:glycosyltransferase involved in cell wall biosynthesis
MSQRNYPSIDSLPQNTCRPFWSVMIPTFNCANYLAKTLESILSQDLGPENMQIEVVDDCSTKDDPEEVVRDLGQGRVLFYRQPKNVGVTKNFNTCISRSRGQVVHILHGDDYVAPLFYESFQRQIEIHSDIDLFVCRSFLVNEKEEIDSLSPRLTDLERPNNSLSELYYQNPIRTPAVVVRRRFYENHGGFAENLRHTTDWEMWVRAMKKGGALAINQPLAYYRFFEGNDTSALARSAANIEEFFALRECFSNFEDFDETIFQNQIKKTAFNQALHFARKNDQDATIKNAQFWWKLLSPMEKLTQIAYIIAKNDRSGKNVLTSAFR